MKTIIVTETATKAVYTFPCAPWKGRKLLEASKMLAASPYMQPDQKPTRETEIYVRSMMVVKAVCDSFTSPDGERGTTEDNLLDLPPEVLYQAASEIQGQGATATVEDTPAQAADVKND